MELFVVTFFVMALAVLGMSVGVIFGRNPIAGSCGGLGAVDGSGRCQSCSRPCRTARRHQARSGELEETLEGQSGASESANRATTTAKLQDLRDPGTR